MMCPLASVSPASSLNSEVLQSTVEGTCMMICMSMQVVTPGYVRIVKGEGMPKSKQPGQKGDVRIVFDVQVRSWTACLRSLSFAVVRRFCSG